MRSFKMVKKNIAVLILAALVAGLFPATYADQASATPVSSLDILIQAISTDAMGTNIEILLEDGNYVVGSGAPVKIPEGKTVTIYAGDNVYLRHQPAENSAMFEVPYGSALYLIGTGSNPIVIENTGLEEINAALAVSAGNTSEQDESSAETAEGDEGTEGEGSGEQGAEATEGEANSSEETQTASLSSASAVRGIINQGELHLSNISFKGFNDEAERENVRGNALLNEGTAYLKNVTVVNASGAAAEKSIRNSGSLEIEEGDERTQDSYIDNSGYFYSKEQRLAEQAAAEQAAAEQAAAEQAAAEQTAAEQAAAEQAAAAQAEADAALQAVIAEAWNYASNAGIQKENTEASLSDAEIISQTPDADRTDVQEDLDETETAYKLARSLAESTEALQLSYPDNEDLQKAAAYARDAANNAENNYYSVKAIYDYLPMTEEMAMALMASESAQTAEDTGDVSNGDADSTVTSSGTSGNDSEAQSQQVVSVQEDYVEEPAAVTVTAAPATSTPAPVSNYTSPASATQDTSAKQSITIYASWNDNNNANSRRPNSVRVTLKVGGAVYTNADVKASDGWTYTFKNLPTGNSYSIEETSVADYTTSYSVSGNTVTLSHTYTGASTTSSAYSSGYTGNYTGTQTTTYTGTTQSTGTTQTYNTTQSTNTAQSTSSTQTAGNTQTAAQNSTGSNTANTKLSVTPGPSSTPVPAYTTAPSVTVSASPSPASAGTTATAATASATRSASHAWIWIVILVLAAGAIIIVLLYLNRLKKEREAAEARARARARRKAQMEAQQKVSREDGDRFEMKRPAGSRSSADIPLGGTPQPRNYENMPPRRPSPDYRDYRTDAGKPYGASNVSGKRTGRYSDGEY